MPAHRFHRELPARVDGLGALAQALSRWCREAGVPMGVAEAAALMVDELLANTVMHGYRGDPTGWIEVQARVVDASLEIVLRDRAPAFDPRCEPLPDTTLPVEQRRIGGLGLLFVRKMADVLDYRRMPDAPGGAMNEVRLVKKFGDRRTGSDAAMQPGPAGA